MNKPFVVPEAEEIGVRAFYAQCPLWHLAHHFDYCGQRVTINAISFLKEKLDPNADYVALYVKNDQLRTPRGRRNNFVRWLRKYFPNNEV